MGLLGLAPHAVVPVAFAQSVDEPVDLGVVTIVSPTRETLTSGDGNTVFGLRLPAGASCPGDSENDQWRVQTFIVPADVDPATLTYDSIGPVGDGRFALYGIDTNPQVHGLTAPNGGTGLPGLIIGLRSMSFEVFPPGTLADGMYRIGVACTYFRETASYWDTVIEIARDPANRPAEMRWENAAPFDPGVVDAGESGSNSNLGLIAASGAAVVAALGLLARRSRRKPPIHQEMS
jgi:hypothetical protein